MSNDTPGSIPPDPGRLPEPGAPPAGGGQWPSELVPPAPVPDASGPAPLTPPVPQAPPPPSAWGAPVPPPPAEPPAAWGSPPAQPGAWAPGPTGPGGPPSGSWAPGPPSSGNGCLKGCLVVGVVLVVLAVLGVIAMGFIANRVVEDMGFNADGTLTPCELISEADVQAILGSDATAAPLGGVVDLTVGQVLDKRLLGEAPDCWLIADASSSLAGRLARQDGGGSDAFAAARQDAVDGGFHAGDVAFGDEAFCTSRSSFGGYGTLVRSGDRVAYVSLVEADGQQPQDVQVTDDGALFSPSLCDTAGRLALASLR